MAIPSVRALESRARAADGDVTVCDWRSLSFFSEGKYESQQSPRSGRGSTDGRQWSDVSDRFAQEGLEEIVVTATRREQNLQEVPISIVAITGEGLETRGIDNLEEVSQGVPNVIITGGGGGTGGTSFRMRGIPNVGTYVDGVWQVGTAGFLTQEFVDIDRVEVLRGPQGTMFGRDSTGGAIRIWTKRPAEEFGGNITATAGSLDRADVKASLDLPLGEKIRTKWTGANLSRDGYINSQTTATNGGGIDQQVLPRRHRLGTPPTTSTSASTTRATRARSPSRVCMDAMFRTFDDPNPNGGSSRSSALPELYTFVGTDYRGIPVEPSSFRQPSRGLSGRPRRPVGEPLELGAAERSTTPSRSRSRRTGSSPTT